MSVSGPTGAFGLFTVRGLFHFLSTFGCLDGDCRMEFFIFAFAIDIYWLENGHLGNTGW